MPKHIVKQGDTIKNILNKYKVDLKNLTLANTNIESFERLKPGGVIYIPNSSDGTFCQVELRLLKPQLLTMLGLSARQIQEHYNLYQGYISKTNEIRSRLCSVDRSGADVTYCNVRSLKKEETFAVNGYKLHEWYFENLGGRGEPAAGPVLQAIVRDFGSYEFWEKDFRATGLSSRGWAILGYDYKDGHLHNHSQDAHDQGSLIGFEPLVVMDVSEHAYFLDYGINRASYIDAFFNNLDWSVINSRWINLKVS